MDSQCHFLLELPTEVLFHIVCYLCNDKPTLLNLRGTCRFVHDLCEPVLCRKIKFCASMTNSQMNPVNQLMSAGERRPHYVEQLSVTASPGPETILGPVGTAFAGFRIMPTKFTNFDNLRYLDLHVNDGWPLFEPGATAECFFAAMASALEAVVFPKLQECSLVLDTGENETPERPLRLDWLFKSPKLTKLRLKGVDLRRLELRMLESKSIRLQHLALNDCALDEQAMSTVLRLPSALRSMEFEAPWSTEDILGFHDPFETHGQIQPLQHLLSTLARFQLGVTHLKLAIKNGTFVFGSEELRGKLDFKPLLNLKVLSLATAIYWNCGLPANSSSRWHQECCPTNAFDKLPNGLECIRLRTRGVVGLNRLAGELLARRSLHGLCRLRIEFASINRGWEQHERPLTKGWQDNDDAVLAGFDQILTRTSVRQLVVRMLSYRGGERIITATNAEGPHDHKAQGKACNHYNLTDIYDPALQ